MKLRTMMIHNRDYAALVWWLLPLIARLSKVQKNDNPIGNTTSVLTQFIVYPVNEPRTRKHTSHAATASPYYAAQP